MGQYGKIAVLAGGISSEREISLKSGSAVFNALKCKGEEVELIDIKKNPEGIIKNLKADLAFIALHGKFGEDGSIQRMLEDVKIPYTGSGVESSRLALDKIASRNIFMKHKLNTPTYKILNKRVDISYIANEFETPFVVKPQFEGSSIGLSIVADTAHTKTALDMAFDYGDSAIIEEYIHGRELTVGILGEESLPVIEIVTTHNVYDFQAKYLDEGTRYVVPAKIDKDTQKNVQESALLAHQALGCRDFSRVDMRMDRDGLIYILEINTIPGLTERSLLPKAASARGITFMDLCMKLVHMAQGRGGI